MKVEELIEYTEGNDDLILVRDHIAKRLVLQNKNGGIHFAPLLILAIESQNKQTTLSTDEHSEYFHYFSEWFDNNKDKI